MSDNFQIPDQSPRWVLVTGAASGMGFAVATRCVRDGYRVLALDRDPGGLDLLRTTTGNAVETFQVDLGQADLEEVVAAKCSALGILGAEATPDSDAAQLVGLVNVAGISQGNSIDKLLDADWQRSMDVNATAPMRLVRCLLPLLRAAEGASIVNVASPVALIGARKVSYSASKGALLGLNAALAQNLGPHNIRVNAVLPGATITGMTNDWPEAKRQEIAKSSPLGRLCRPEDVAGAIAFLLGPDSAFITGSVLNVTGGMNMGL